MTLTVKLKLRVEGYAAHAHAPHADGIIVEFLRLRSETSSKPNEVVCIRKRGENAPGRI